MDSLAALATENNTLLAELEERLDYVFRNRQVLQLALVHRSFSFEMAGMEGNDNERLEFLGDAVLDLAISQILYRAYPVMREGEMTRLRAMLVKESHLAELAESLDLGRYLFLGKGEDASAGRTKPSILSSTYEAVIGAIFDDGGFADVSIIIEQHFSGRVETQKKGMGLADAKSRLQELTQERYGEAPEYVLEKEDGPDHCKMFTISVRFRGVLLATGKARSKKEAEQQSAAEAILKIDEIPIPET
ncbi:MAG: ribonuclease III [Proteobacteria bacterium]|nr:ribonuclease III [Pseudomonadota bacterium]MBU1737999.1 ribonuclease III [Pseudomonadota bacterium]